MVKFKITVFQGAATGAGLSSASIHSPATYPNKSMMLTEAAQSDF